MTFGNRVVISLLFLFSLSNFPVYADQCTPPADHAYNDEVIECWQLYVRYQPCVYTTRKLVREQVPDAIIQCSRPITKFRIVENIDPVLEYTTALLLSNEPNNSGCYALKTADCYDESHLTLEPYEELEYYNVQHYQTICKWVYEKHCKYIPQLYWKRVKGCAYAGK